MGESGTVNIVGVVSVILGVGMLTVSPFLLISIPMGAPLSQLIFNIIGVAIIFLFLISYVVGGIGLLNGKNWARILLIIVSIMGLIIFPFITIISICFLIVLFSKKTKALMK